MWIRFETCYRDDVSRWATGVFQFMTPIAEDYDLDAGLRTRIQEHYNWFNENLPALRRSAVNRKSIFWFKTQPDLGQPLKVSPWKRRPLTKLAARVPRPAIPSDRPIDQPRAAECIQRLTELVGLINRAGYTTRRIATRRPGYIVYEDAYQIAAIPFRDNFIEHELEDWLAD